MKIELGGQLLDKPVASHVTLQELLDMVQVQLLEGGEAKIILGVELDGKALTQDAYEAIRDEPLRDEMHLKIEVAPVKEHLMNCLADAEQFHKGLEADCHVTAAPHQPGREKPPLPQTIFNLRQWLEFWRSWTIGYPKLMHSIEVDRTSLAILAHRGRRAVGELIAADRANGHETLINNLLLYEIAPCIALLARGIKPLRNALSQAELTPALRG